MAPGSNLEDGALPDGRSPSVQPNGAHSPSTSSNDSQSADQPPAKKPRLKLNGPRVKDTPSDTIAVTRPRRETNVRFRYSQEMDFQKHPEAPARPKRKVTRQPEPEPEPVEALSPASSGLSSLESAPASDREESPFKDPTPPPDGEQYGNFLSYYVEGMDEDEGKKSDRPKATPKSRANGKQNVQATEPAKAPSQTFPSLPPPKPVATPQPPPPVQNQHNQQAQPPALPPGGPRQGPPPPPPQQMPPHQMASQQMHPQPPMQHQNQPPRPQNIPPPYPPGPPSQRQQYQPPPPPPPMPQPVIQFIDIKHDPKPQRPVTVAEMIRKLNELSQALTNFGAGPEIPPSPPPEKPPKKESKKPQPSNNPLDNFLSHFGEDDDESDSDKEESLDYVLPNPGAPDGPLMYGIQFIQNALKSWAQQRLTHQVTQQYQAQHQQQMHQQQAQRRGPGRPRTYNEPDHLPVGPPAVIHTDLAATPEGVAIKAFQSVLDSGCLQVNTILPIELSRALRHLYMQIDHLINQGAKADTTNWQCFSYSAQIAAHRSRVEKWKEDQAKAQAEMAKRQQMMDQHRMAQMGFAPAPGSALANEQAQKQHAIDLERKRSMQHAEQQPYISQQHLHPLDMNARPSGTPVGAAPSPVPNGATPQPHHTPTTTTATTNGPPQNEVDGPQAASNTPTEPNKVGSSQVQFDKVKMYMPNFLPRSGQNMKFSFAPNNVTAVEAFGSEAFPQTQPSSRLPNRGPMSAPPRQGDDAQMPIELDSDMSADKAFASPPKPAAPAVPATGGWTAVNAPAPSSEPVRPSSLPSGSPTAAETGKGR